MLTFVPQQCANCQICSSVCSFRQVGEIKPSAAAIRIFREDRFADPKALYCDQCTDAFCVKACPEDALKQDAKGVIHYSAELCTACLACVDSCKNVSYNPATERVIICDLCEGEPLCVKWCPEKAIIEDSKGGDSK